MSTAERLRTEGRAEGRCDLLLELLTSRFGALPADVSARVRAGSDSDLARWAKALLRAMTIEDVFAA